jgi:hypothetical protein
MNGCLLRLGPSKVRECLCGSKPGGEMPRGQPAGSRRQFAGVRGGAKTLKFYRYGAKAVNTIKFEED